MTKQDWQDLAETRLIDAGILLQNQRWSAVYYLAGYAVECGLKACVVGFVENNPGIIYEERRFSDACWTHKLSELIGVARLDAACVADSVANPAFAQNWAVTIRWNEASRYVLVPEPKARELYDATSHPQDGVMKWIRDHW
ncbi:MAG TPA: hypothetical protein VNH11_16710 [Pirellulales bacterium]|nr:hypothetical protein [Pirellulales bacterium]